MIRRVSIQCLHSRVHADFVIDDVWDEDSAYIEMLANEVSDDAFTGAQPDSRGSQGARLREKSEKQAAGDEVSESSEESDMIDEELGYISPLDAVNPYVSFKLALTST